MAPNILFCAIYVPFPSLSMNVFKNDNVKIAQQSFVSRFTGVVVGGAIFVMVMYRHAANTVAVGKRHNIFYFKFERSTDQSSLLPNTYS